MTNTNKNSDGDFNQELRDIMSDWQVILFKDALVQLRVIPFRNSTYDVLRRFK